MMSPFLLLLLSAASAEPRINININTTAATHTVDGGFVSFALDQPWLVNFTANAAGRKVDFSSPVFLAVMTLVGATATASGQGGYIRLGGTYTDGVDYVGFGGPVSFGPWLT